jgi:hypothetical protein
MNKLLILSAALLFVFGCGGTAKTPEDVALEFAKAMDKGDFKGAKAFGTESTNKMLEMVEPMLASMGDKIKEEMGKGKFEKATCEGTGDKKNCKVCCDDKGNEMDLVLVQKDGKWLVDMNKESMNKDQGAGEETTPDTTETQTEPAPAEHGSGH